MADQNDVKCDIAIVYDTSYLMNTTEIAPLNFFHEELQHSGSFFTDLVRGFTQRKWCFHFTHFVAEEVRREIAKHYANDEKKHDASRARKNLARLLEIDDCVICNLDEVAKPLIVDDLLGADSPTDRLLLGFAIALEKEKRMDAVFLATDDGGLILDVVTLRKRKQTEMAVLSTDPEVSGSILPSLFDLFVRRGGKWNEKGDVIESYRDYGSIPFGHHFSWPSSLLSLPQASVAAIARGG